MASFDSVKADVEALKANAEETAVKMDAVVAKVSELKDLVAQLQSAGQGASPEQLDQLAALVAGASASLQSVEDKADSAVA